MDITFDPAKDASNKTKHGVSLALAARIEWETAVTYIDTRRDYGETRLNALGYLGRRLYFVAFADRDGQRRVISLRKANRREINRYAKT